MSHSEQLLQSRLVELVRGSPMLMRALRAARTVDPPDWLIGAGAIRDCVWDRLHGLARNPRATKDIDLAFFDATALGSDRERGIQSALSAHASDLGWDVTNQAALHLWYPTVFGIDIEPLRCCAEAVATWPETATAVAVRLHNDDSIHIVAPYGLHDLFGLICRHNPRLITSEQYRSRVQNKRIARRWPKVQILDMAD